MLSLIKKISLINKLLIISDILSITRIAYRTGEDFCQVANYVNDT